jgi:very-short-patch-repair endonuclease
VDPDLIRALDAIASRQRSLITSSQADATLGRSRAARWRADGRLLPAQPRVHRLAGSVADWHQAIHAAVLSADGVVSHRSAAALWGLRAMDGVVEISVPAARCPRMRPPATVHRIKDLQADRAVLRAGLPITDPMRTVIDLGLVLDVDAVDDALSAGLASKLFPLTAVSRLRDALGRPGRNGTGVMRELLEHRGLLGAGEQSVLEGRLLRLVRRHHLPTPVFQHEVWHRDRFVARVDAAWPEVLLALEVDGYEFHATPESFQGDRSRDVRLATLGWVVLRFTWEDVVGRPRQVAEAVLDLLSSRSVNPAAR